MGEHGSGEGGVGKGRILVTGGAGTMGRKLSRALSMQGWKTRILCLPGDPAAKKLEDASVEIVFGDVTRKSTLGAAVAGVHTVYHLAAILISPAGPALLEAVNAEGTRNMVEAAEAAGVVHFVYVSSVSVLYPWSNAYARSKLKGEAWVKAARSFRYTIIRPSLAYEDGGALEFMRFVEHLQKGKIIWLPAGGRARKSPVHVDDLVEGFTAIAGNSKAYGKTYHFTGGETLTLRQMSEALLAHMGLSRPVVGVPAWLCFIGIGFLTAWAKISGRKNSYTFQSFTGLLQNADADNAEAKRDLGYNPRPFRVGLAGLKGLAAIKGVRVDREGTEG